MPRVAVLSTGDEVVEPSRQNLKPGQIRDANRAMLVAASQQAGAKVLDLGIARDTQGQVEACLKKAIQEQVDVLVTTGSAAAHRLHMSLLYTGIYCGRDITCVRAQVAHAAYKLPLL